MPVSRRGVLSAFGAAVALGAAGRAATAPFAPDLGVQLWMVRQSMAADFPGTLARLASLGVRKVELAGAPDLPAAELRRRIDDAGLACVSGHLPLLQMTDAEVDRRLAFAAEVGMTDVVAPLPGFASLLELEPGRRLSALLTHSLTEADWMWNADRLSALGARARAAGLRVGYHNHNVEFADLAGRRPIELLLARVDPALAHFQLDVGNAVLGGGDPFAILVRHPGRFRSAHLKDWAPPLSVTQHPASPPSAAFGAGVIDWRKWRSSAAAAGLSAWFIERENLPASQELTAAAQGLVFFRS